MDKGYKDDYYTFDEKGYAIVWGKEPRNLNQIGVMKVVVDG